VTATISISTNKLTIPQLTPQLLKSAVAAGLNDLLTPIRADFDASTEFQDVLKKAYPPPEQVKKVKKVKNKGSGYPGAAKKVVAQPDGSVEGEAKQDVDLGTSNTAETLEELKIEGEAVGKADS